MKNLKKKLTKLNKKQDEARYQVLLPDKIYDNLIKKMKEEGIHFEETTIGKEANKTIKQINKKYD